MLEYNPEWGNPLVYIRAEYKYIENGWSNVGNAFEFSAPEAPKNFENMDAYIKNLASISGIDSFGDVVYTKDEYSYRGVRKKGIKHEGTVFIKGDDGKTYVRLTLSIDSTPTSGVVTKSYGGKTVSSLASFINSIYQDAISAKHDKPMPEAMKIINRISGHDANVEAAGAEGDLTKPHIDTLQAIVDGQHDGDDLGELLDKIDAAAQALVDDGKGEEFDALIGAAAEHWAALDQKANG